MWSFILPISVHAEVGSLSRDQQTNDETEKAEDGAEDLDDENLNETMRTYVSFVGDHVSVALTGWGLPRRPEQHCYR